MKEHLSKLKFLTNKYLLITVIFFIIIIPLSYHGFNSYNPIIGSYVIAICSVYVMLITNFKNNDNTEKHIEYNKNLISLEMRKSEMKEAIEEARQFFHFNYVFIGDYEVNLFSLLTILYKDYFEYLPIYIQKDIKDFIHEISENNNLELENHLESIHNVYRVVEIGEWEFCYYYKNIEQTVPYDKDFRLVFDLFSKVNDKDKEKIRNFCFEKSESLKSNKIDDILNKEFFDN